MFLFAATTKLSFAALGRIIPLRPDKRFLFAFIYISPITVVQYRVKIRPLLRTSILIRPHNIIARLRSSSFCVALRLSALVRNGEWWRRRVPPPGP